MKEKISWKAPYETNLAYFLFCYFCRLVRADSNKRFQKTKIGITFSLEPVTRFKPQKKVDLFHGVKHHISIYLAEQDDNEYLKFTLRETTLLENKSINTSIKEVLADKIAVRRQTVTARNETNCPEAKKTHFRRKL